ncbi:prepilin-type N-terminal cleavage/methylation domain-containing protein [uncultured Pseudokineococcus sp.]|uniref:prepilin-type N-terminal cleavage/methylation domain-containing protein n=1 Tax=uncultured Pseudokineococcus sp. TaxID=1642928 RepID=UPI002629156F|nr:carboxypeptidase regulatory-like domain-containing protein [uncultured Pseudokineococcus sp.]
MRDVDAGFSLVEVMVAALVLAVGAAAVASVLIGALGLTRDNAQRVQAAGLMTAQLEAARARPVDDIPATTTSTTTEAGTTYTTTTSAAWGTSGGGTDACVDATVLTATKRVVVTVTWPDMGTTEPVTGTTLVAATPTSEVLTTLPGAVAVQVRDADGAGVPDAQVVLSAGGTATTGSTGCASFTGVSAGSYTAAASKAGAVGRSGEAAVSTGAFSVLPGRVARPRADLDLAGTLTVSTVAPAAGAAVRDAPLTLDAPFFTPRTRRVVLPCGSAAAGSPCVDVSVSPSVVRGLFPGAYRVAGCSSAPGPEAVTVERGKTTATTLSLATANLVSATTTPLPATLYARPAPDGPCQSAPSLTIEGPAGPRSVAMPDGSWTFSRSADYVTSVTVSLAASTSTTVQVPQ